MNIPYELAQQINRAGFDFSKNHTSGMPECAKCHAWANEPVHYPSLLELIEACQVYCNDFRLECKTGCVDFEENNKTCFQAMYRVDGVFQVFGGDSPSEAVAKLWLALHNK